MRAKKFKTMIFHKYQKCTRAKKSKITMVHKYQQCARTYFFGQMIGHSLKIVLIHRDLLMILHFVKISGLLRFSKTYYGKSPSKTLIDTIFWGESLQTIKKIGSGGSKIGKLSKLQKIEK